MPLSLVSQAALPPLPFRVLQGSDNWQKYLQTKNAIFDYFVDRYDEENNKGNVQTIRSGDQWTIGLSATGYNAFHRAAQGANLAAIEKFFSLGANPFLKTTDGSRLWLSILYAVKCRPFLNLDRPSVLTSLEVELASFSASAILSYLLRNGKLDVGCNKSHPDLTIYHVAATRGMWQFIAHLLSSSEIIGMDVNCNTKL